MKKCHMAAKLKSLKMEISDGFLVYFIMSSLPPEFSPFTINYNAMKIKWSIDEMIAMCVQEEERLKAERIEHIDQFQTSQKRQYKRFVNEYMKSKNPQFKNKGQCFKKIQQNKPQQKPQQNTNTDAGSEEKKEGCHFCGKPGHFQKDCIGLLRWLNKKGNDVINFVDESLYVDYATNTWWIDSGASVYVANSLQGFATKMTLRKGERKIRVANGVEVEAEAVGVFTLLLHTGFELQLNNVLYVSSMKRNLVSVSCLDDDGFGCNFGNKKCIIMYNESNVGLAIRQDKLYLISTNDAINNVVSTPDNKRKRDDNETSSKLWHYRLCHISRGRIERLIKENILHSLVFDDEKCIDCIKGKYPKKIKKGANRSQGVLEQLWRFAYLCFLESVL